MKEKVMIWARSQVAKKQYGFALPTVLIASVIMLIVLLAALSTVTSVQASLNQAVYERQSKLAAESGINYANACLEKNNYTATWNNANPLRPNTDCNGGAACTNADSCFLSKTGVMRTSFEIGAPDVSSAGGQFVSAKGILEIVGKDSNTVNRSLTATESAKVSGNIATSQVVFGYADEGAFFATVGGDGVMRATGFNAWGQLGNGAYANTAVPTQFKAPTTYPIVAGYTNPLSLGWNLYALDSNGDAYGAGVNGDKQVGSGSTDANIATPQKVAIPDGKKVRKVIPGGWANYFLTTDGNIYASGKCGYGQLGDGATTVNCTDKSNPVRVALPTPNPADPNTMPSDNIVSDRINAYVRMQGGRVYGWGMSEFGQVKGTLGWGPTYVVPQQIGTYGNGGVARAVDVQTDGMGVYILDSDGILKTMGRNMYGQTGSRTFSLMNYASSKCLDVLSSNNVTLQLYACNGSPAQIFTMQSNNLLRNLNSGRCFDNQNWDKVNVNVWTCSDASPSTAQVIAYDPRDAHWWHPFSGNCLDNLNADGLTIKLSPCNTSGAQVFDPVTPWLEPFNMSGISGRVVAITTDMFQVSILTSNGEVWSAGQNTSGMFGNGTTSWAQFDPIKFQLPAGVKGTYIYSTATGGYSDPKNKNLFVVGDDGKVYGAGDNSSGQLGNGTTAATQTTPVAMQVIDGVKVRAKTVQSGRGTTVVYTEDGSVYTVGNNANGQLGDGTTTNKLTPIRAKYLNDLKTTRY